MLWQKNEYNADEFEVLNGKVREFGISGFIFSAEIPVYKNSLLHQKTEHKEVKSHLTRKKAFSADGRWMALGFQLMGLCTITCAVKAN